VYLPFSINVLIIKFPKGADKVQEHEIILEILKVIVEGETKRNKLFEKTLHIFLTSLIGIVLILSIANIVLFANMFVNN